MSTYYHPSDTRGIVKSEVVFDLQKYCVDKLNSGNFPLRELPWGIKLSKNANIEVESRDNTWTIADKDRIFRVWIEQGTLNVYEHKSILPNEYVETLNSGQSPPKDFLQSIGFSQNARVKVTVDSKGNKWRLEDRRDKYLIWNEDGTLNVYKQVLNLQSHYVSYLNHGGTPAPDVKNSIELSNNARIEVVSRNNRWLITDEKDKYLARNERNTVNVYKRPAIENCSLEYCYFLEIDASGKPEFPRYVRPPKSDIINRLRERQTQHLLQFAKQGLQLYCVDATVDWRLIVGLGSENVQETNMTLHHIYGVPYIPGSAVKGVLRHWWLQMLQEDKGFLQENPDFLTKNGEVDETIALNDRTYREIFGSQKQRGQVKFLDAYPERFKFATDIMNPHYRKYYSKQQPPTDDQDPALINFLTVEKTTFRFVFMAKDKIFFSKLKGPFEKALDLKGIGAKTAVGYGYFDNNKFTDRTNVITDELKQQQKEAEKQRKAERLASLSPVERLAEEVKSLTDSQVDEQRVSQICKEQLPSLEENDKHKIAQALKVYWQRINKWEGGSNKQRQKVMEVKSILNER